MLRKNINSRIFLYARLMRLDKPIGFLLLLWPTLWALWLASAGHPPLTILLIFSAGVILMRTAGCIVNDVADRKLDAQVARTRARPLATGEVSLLEAGVLFSVMLLAALLLVLKLNLLTLYLSFIGVVLAVIYPFLKRVTHLPQAGLGLAFSWGIPMAFAAIQNTVPYEAWVLFAVAAVWPLMYDTLYAITDRVDDLKFGAKSTAILFARYERRIVALLQGIFLAGMIYVGKLFYLAPVFYLCLFAVAFLFLYQQWLLRVTENAFRAFLNNNWVGLLIFAGVAGSYLQ
jgi:4-hydroxybenzoate polyprenyltransferase